MGYRHYTLALDGTVQRLSDVFGAGPGVAPPADDVPFRSVTFQPGLSNTNYVYIGGDETITTTSYGLRLHAPELGPPITFPANPIWFGGGYDTGPIKLSDYYVLGTAGEALHVSGVPF